MHRVLTSIFLMIIMNGMAQRTIKTEIEIAAPPAVVWEVLTDFSAYAAWNPFITHIEGACKVGNTIDVRAGDMKFSPKVLVFEPQKEFRWIGKFLFKGLFDGEHSFRIIDHHDGTVTFKHEEHFSGLLVGLFAKKLKNETLVGFEQMNHKLKEVAEKQVMTIQHIVGHPVETPH